MNFSSSLGVMLRCGTFRKVVTILARMGTTGDIVGPAVVGTGVGLDDTVGDNVGSSVGLIGSGVCPCICELGGGEGKGQRVRRCT